jgi:DNA recombination protein RmuC
VLGISEQTVMEYLREARGRLGVRTRMLLEDMLTKDQFATNVRIRPEASEIVEFAVRLPGRAGEDMPLWLPIDAKFPHEDYDRLLVAQDSGAVDDVEKAALDLERAIKLQAKTICEKYVHPPHSTDFAIMYLPTEGLFAEVIRRPGLASEMQTKHRVMIQGPTTLAALLSSLQMGFRTLAIEKRSSEVWQVLGAAKAEFLKYGQVWEKLGKQLDTARKTVDEAGKRTRAVSRKLRDVETLEGPETPALIDLVLGEEDDQELSPTEAADSSVSAHISRVGVETFGT